MYLLIVSILSGPGVRLTASQSISHLQCILLLFIPMCLTAHSRYHHQVLNRFIGHLKKYKGANSVTVTAAYMHTVDKVDAKSDT